MQIRIGLSGNDLESRVHETASFASDGALSVEPVGARLMDRATVAPGRALPVRAKRGILLLEGLSPPLTGGIKQIRIAAADHHSVICLTSLLRSAAGGRRSSLYKGMFDVIAVGDKVRIV